MTTAARRHAARAAIASAAVGLTLILAAAIFPLVTGVDVRVNWPPLHANWMPRVTWWSILPIVVGALVVAFGRRAASTLGWGPFLSVSYLASWAWTMSVAFVDGPSGLSSVFERPREYWFDAVRVESIPVMLAEFVERIPFSAAQNWETHVAGHPPAALLFFVILNRLGIEDTFWVGFAVVLIGTTSVIGGAWLIRTLAGEEMARKVMVWWVLAPAAITMAVSGDAVFTAVSVWGLALLAYAAKASKRSHLIGAGVGSGVLLGLCVYLSYGLVLLGIPALAVLYIARNWRPLAWSLGGALAVAGVFTAFGFAWWEAYPVLRDRYYAGIASERPYYYWVWANLATSTFMIGLATWAAVPRAVADVRRRAPHAVMAAAAAACMLIATLSGMSKAEVERIWLPFTFWLLMLPALLPERWHRPLLVSQIVTALLIQHLLLPRH